MKPINFNRKMAELDGLMLENGNIKKGDIEVDPAAFPHYMPDYYNDLNILMPLAWKHDSVIDYDSPDKIYSCYQIFDSGEKGTALGIAAYAEDKDPVEAVRKFLIEIADKD